MQIHNPVLDEQNLDTAQTHACGLVIHCGQFDKLEHQLATFTYDANKNRKNGSPDRLDALVWGLTELLVIEQEKRGGGSRRVKGLLF